MEKCPKCKNIVDLEFNDKSEWFYKCRNCNFIRYIALDKLRQFNQEFIVKLKCISRCPTKLSNCKSCILDALKNNEVLEIIHFKKLGDQEKI